MCIDVTFGIIKLKNLLEYKFIGPLKKINSSETPKLPPLRPLH